MESGKFNLTNNGIEWTANFFEKHEIPEHLNGFYYQGVGELFWKRLSLSVQALSNLVYQKSKYYPVQRDLEVQVWVREFLKESNLEKLALSKLFFQEMKDALLCIDQDPSLLVKRLSGYGQIGLTFEQLATELKSDKYEVWFFWLNLLHQLMNLIISNKDHYPYLYRLLNDLDNGIPMTHSTKETYRWINKGRGIKEIARLRNLKESTIEDHVIEIILQQSHFPIAAFVNPEMEKEIVLAAKKINSKKLTQIKKSIPHASYFEIRVTLAKYGEALWI